MIICCRGLRIQYTTIGLKLAPKNQGMLSSTVKYLLCVSHLFWFLDTYICLLSFSTWMSHEYRKCSTSSTGFIIFPLPQSVPSTFISLSSCPHPVTWESSKVSPLIHTYKRQPNPEISASFSALKCASSPSPWSLLLLKAPHISLGLMPETPNWFP